LNSNHDTRAEQSSLRTSGKLHVLGLEVSGIFLSGYAFQRFSLSFLDLRLTDMFLVLMLGLFGLCLIDAAFDFIPCWFF
jgi:hypothetical protein